MTAEAQVTEKNTTVTEATPPIPETKEAASLTPQSSGLSQENEVNWKKFREERAQERKEKAEAERKAAEKAAEAEALKAAMESLLAKPQIHSSAQIDDKTEEQLIEEKVLSILERNEKKRDEERRKKEAAEIPHKLSQTFSDFNQVCSQENIDYLRFKKPHLWDMYKNVPETYEMWTSLYKTLKETVPNTDTKKDLAKIEKNLSKPQSMSQPGMTSTGDHAPTNLTEQRKKDNFARMQRVMKGVK
jgi:hypothetical protein